MKCPECGAEIDENDLRVEISWHDEMLFDMILKCPECQTRYNAFVSINDFTRLEKE